MGERPKNLDKRLNHRRRLQNNFALFRILRIVLNNNRNRTYCWNEKRRYPVLENRPTTEILIPKPNEMNTIYHQE